MADDHLLQLTGITKRFPGIVANDHVDFDLAKGEVHALLGENGAGKSTLMNILYGLYHADEGEIRVNGKPLRIDSPNDAIKAGIGMVHQHFMLIPVMTVAENIVLAVEPHSGPFLDLGAAEQRVRDLSQRYRAHRRPYGPGRADQRRPAATRRDPEGALSRRRDPHPRRAHRRAHAAGGERALRHHPLAHRAGEVDHLHQPQAQRGAGDRRPDHRPSPGKARRHRPARRARRRRALPA